MDMTHPDILYAERHGHGPWQAEAEPALLCEVCGEGICEGEEYSDIGPMCESCEDLHTWRWTDDEGADPAPACCDCGRQIGHDEAYLSPPDGDGAYCADCADRARNTAWAA